MRLLTLLCTLAAALPAPTLKKGSPLENLPSHLEQLTRFGERADFSPDNKRVAFMATSFGDAFEIDLVTRRTRCLTCSIPGAAFLRVQYLANGDCCSLRTSPTPTSAPAGSPTAWDPAAQPACRCTPEQPPCTATSDPETLSGWPGLPPTTGSRL